MVRLRWLLVSFGEEEASDKAGCPGCEGHEATEAKKATKAEEQERAARQET
jgi:hypothetical protein